MELQKRSFRPPSSLRTSWMSVWVAFSGGGGVQHPSPRQSGERCGCLSGWHAMEHAEEELPSTKQSENIVDVCLGGIHWRWHPSPRRSGNVVGVCLGGIRCSGSPRTSWVSVWVACNGAAEEELPSTKQSEIVVEVCLGCIHWRWRSAASVAQAVRKRRGCLSGWHSLLRQSENVVGVCLGGMQWSCRRGASVDQAV